ncbi:MAG TPA: hypothetical protein PLL78_00780 [Fimbriimonadaceae bacterium]|nr:hypothetical protein [Fimbriimonadaceae bacterium]HRJ95196.1 hypothetical protein [Fimbriimonadaceae bacterium]
MQLVELFAISIPIFALMIPIVAILTHHQRKMAELIHQRGVDDTAAREVVALRAEVHELKQLLQTQIIAMDGLSRGGELPATPPPPPRTTDRVV